MIKVAIFGLDIPLGKKNISDERLDKLVEVLRSPKVTYLQIEFQDSSHLKDAQVVLCSDKTKLDLILMDLEVIEQMIAQGSQDADLLLRVKQTLEKESFISQGEFGSEDKKILGAYNLITYKPIICINQQAVADLDRIIKKVYTDSGRITFFTANQRELRAWSATSKTGP